MNIKTTYVMCDEVSGLLAEAEEKTKYRKEEQILKAVSEAAGFVYCISIRGITGSALSLDVETRKKIAFAKKHSKTPVVLGFGIRDAESARVALHNADGFIMGTCAIEILKREGVSGLENFFAKLTAALA